MDFYISGIFIIDNFLTEDECARYITEILDNTHKQKLYRDTLTVDCKFPKINEKLTKLFPFYNFTKPETQKTVVWPENSQMKEHFDIGDKYASIIYLNDNFEGGEIIIDKMIVKPKKGRCVLFSNGINIHEVKQIKKGTRYTLASWFV